MQSIQHLFARLVKFRGNTGAIINGAFEASLDGYEDINRERMNDGIRSTGSEMPHYNYVSQTKYGYPDSPIKLHDKGDFQAAIVATFANDMISVKSTDWKNDMLVERYGNEIFGTGEGRAQVYRNAYISEYLKPELNKGITLATGLGFK